MSPISITALPDGPPDSGPPRLLDMAIGEGYSAASVAEGHLLLFHRKGGELLLESLEPSGVFSASAETIAAVFKRSVTGKDLCDGVATG